MLLVLALACAAPVPPPLARLEPHHLVGAWDYGWNATDGKIVFHADGTYVSRHTAKYARREWVTDTEYRDYECDHGYTHAGYWELDGNTLTLAETSYSDGWRDRGHYARYVVPLDVRKYPALAGRTVFGGEFRFSNPRR